MFALNFVIPSACSLAVGANPAGASLESRLMAAALAVTIVPICL